MTVFHDDPWMQMQVWDILHDPALSSLQEADESAVKEVAAGAVTQPRDHATPEDRAASRRQMRVSKFSARTPVYQNCKMLSADGSLLCHCDLRKLNWYQVGPPKLLTSVSCSALRSKFEFHIIATSWLFESLLASLLQLSALLMLSSKCQYHAVKNQSI